MPSPTTVLQLGRDGLALTNAVGADQTLTADESATVLRVFNDLVENWSTQSLAVWGQANQTFNTVNGQAVYTIGTSGADWTATARHIAIDDPAYSVINNVTFPCVSIGQDQYNRIAVKGQAQEFPDYYLFVNDFPTGRITLWPVPNAVTPITFSINRVLTQATAIGQTVSFPPGYAKAFKYALGVELAPEFGKDIANYPGVLKVAQDSFGDIKRVNKKKRSMVIGREYSDQPYTIADFYRGW